MQIILQLFYLIIKVLRRDIAIISTRLLKTQIKWGRAPATVSLLTDGTDQPTVVTNAYNAKLRKISIRVTNI